jgi:biuret amidohydrolase
MNRRDMLGAGTVGLLATLSAPTICAPAASPGIASGVNANFAVDPGRTAFINVDLQNCFVEGSPVSAPDGPKLLKRINAFANFCRRKGVMVIHTAHVLRPGMSNAGRLADYILPIREGMITKGSRTAELHPDLIIDSRDIVLEKPRFGAFQGTDLELILRTRGIESVVIGGISTNVCCETTAREAAVRDFQMLFLSDGTATSDLGRISAEQVQQTTCATLQMFGQVLTLDEMARKL